MQTLGIMAGNGEYPLALARSARAAGVSRIVVVGFTGETREEMKSLADEMTWLRVGQLGKLIDYFQSHDIKHVIMAGQIAPSNLFDLQPDFKALVLLAKLKERNAETIFGAIAKELGKAGIELLPATRFLEHWLPEPGVLAGPKIKRRVMEDIQFGLRMAKAVSALDIGQTVVVKNGTVLSVEAFEGTNEAVTRGGALGKGNAVMVKVSKPNQDFRFDVPVIGEATLQTAHKAGIAVIACEARKTLLLEREKLIELANAAKISLVAVE